jgi:hypothetical protein
VRRLELDPERGRCTEVPCGLASHQMGHRGTLCHNLMNYLLMGAERISQVSWRHADRHQIVFLRHGSWVRSFRSGMSEPNSPASLRTHKIIVLIITFPQWNLGRQATLIYSGSPHVGG